MPDRASVLLAYLRRPTRRRLEKVVRAYHELVWSTAYRITRNRADAEDIAQDVFLKLLLHPPPPETVRSPAAYFTWCVIGRATNLRRADERRQERETRGMRAAEADGKIDISDVLYTLNWLFTGTNGPPALGVDCVTIAGCPDNTANCSAE